MSVQSAVAMTALDSSRYVSRKDISCSFWFHPLFSLNNVHLFVQPSAHQLYRANRMLAANGGQASTSNPGPTRHRPPPSVVGNYHQTAESFGAIINRHAHSAVNGALLAARDNIQAGIPTASLDIDVVNST